MSTLGNGVQVKISSNACNKENITYHQKIALYPRYYLLHYLKTINGKETNSINLINTRSRNGLGRYDEQYNFYLSRQGGNEIFFIPSIDEDYIVKQINYERDTLKVEYPDGSIITGTIQVKPYPKDKLEKALKEQKRLQESMGVFPIDTSKNPDACKNL